MMTVEEIEMANMQLGPAELNKLRAWYEVFDAQHFDERIERDARADKLDKMADEALTQHRAGRTREL